MTLSLMQGRHGLSRPSGLCKSGLSSSILYPFSCIVSYYAARSALPGITDRADCRDESQQCDSSAQSTSECNSHTIVPYPSCICSDVPVQVSDPSAPLFTCAQEYNNGNCGQSFLKDTVVTIPEGELSDDCPSYPTRPSSLLERQICCGSMLPKMLTYMCTPRHS